MQNKLIKDCTSINWLLCLSLSPHLSRNYHNPMMLTNCLWWPMLWKVTFPDWLSFLAPAGEKSRKTQLNDTFLLFASKQMVGFYSGYNINRDCLWWKWMNLNTWLRSLLQCISTVWGEFILSVTFETINGIEKTLVLL